LEKNHIDSSNNGVILVLGMHRSGTSALAGCIAKLGVQTPSQLMPPTPDNPKGYWETFELMHIHDRLLESADLEWSDVSPFPQTWYQTDSAHLFKTEIQAFLSTQINQNQLFLIKDPRICRIPGFWFEMLEANNTKTHTVFSLRNPLEVAESLFARDKIPIAIGCLLWLRHILDSELSSRKLSRSFVRYEDLIAAPKEALSKVANDLDISWPSDNWDEIESFMEPNLRHHSVNPKELTAEKELPEIIGRTARVLDLLVDSPKSDSAMNSLNMIRNELFQSELLYEPALAEKKKLAAKLKEQLSESRTAHSKLGSSYKWLTQKNQLLEEKLKELGYSLQEAEQQIAQQNETLFSKYEHIKVLEKENSIRDIELNKLTHMYLQTYRQFTSLHNEAQSTKASKLSGVYTLLKILRTCAKNWPA